MRNKTRTRLAVTVCVLGAIGLAVFLRRPVDYRSDQFLMDTLVSIRVYGRGAGKLRKAVSEAYAEMRRIADLTDRFPLAGSAGHAASDVCRINDMAGIGPVRVDPDVITMLELSRKHHARTRGAFDVTIGPVMDLWGFGGKHPHVPGDEELKSSLAMVGDAHMHLNRKDRTVYLDKPGMRLDLGAVAKGYATEKAIQVLKRNGIEKAIIDAGGTIRVIGTHARGVPWRVGIKKPGSTEDILAVLSLQDSAAATSAGYYRYFDSGRRRFHHILNPGTGYPAMENESVTVVAGDAGLADVLSTALFVLKPEEALEIVNKLTGVEAVLVTSDGRILYSEGLADRVEVTSGERRHHGEGR